MKPKVVRNKKAGEVIVSYFRNKNVDQFRYALLKKMVAGADTDITLMINTNQCKAQLEFEEIERALDEAGITYESWPVDENARRIFGIRADFLLKGKSKKQMLYVTTISPEQFTEEVFENLFKYYDMLFGLGRQMEHEKVVDAIKIQSYDSVIFNKKYFENSVYDSIACESVRSTVDIVPYVKELR